MSVRLPVAVPPNGGVTLGTCFLIRIKVTEGAKITRQTSVSSFMGTLVSFFGLRPGFGFAGITHSFEASKSEKSERRERELTVHTNTHGQPTALRRRAPHCPQYSWCGATRSEEGKRKPIIRLDDYIIHDSRSTRHPELSYVSASFLRFPTCFPSIVRLLLRFTLSTKLSRLFCP